MPTTDSLRAAVNFYTNETSEYLGQWLYDQPLIASKQTVDNLQQAGPYLSKYIRYFGTHFVDKDLHELMPVSDRVKTIFNIFNQREHYNVGSYRTDYVFDRNINPKFIEITCQFSLNAFFQSAFYAHQSTQFAAAHSLNNVSQDHYSKFVPFLMDRIGNASSIAVLKGRDKIQSSRFFVPIFRKAGFEVKEISYKDIWENRDFIKRSFVVSEIMLDEIETLTDAELVLIAEADGVNDYRTIFVAHDKRFLPLLSNKDLQREILLPAESEHLNRYLIDTYRCDFEPERIQSALINKDEWILKHISLGRSREIFAGLEVTQDEWESLLSTSDLSKFVLQKWVPQRTFCGTVKGTQHNDYLTGTLLYFDEAFFGLGLFRSSSHIVANKVDNRNIFPLILNDPQSIPDIDVVARF